MSNSKFQRAQELLVDEQFSLVTEEQLTKVTDSISEIYTSLSKMQEVSIIVHSCNETRIEVPKFSLVFTGTIETRDSLASGFDSLTSQATDVKDKPSFFSEIGKRLFSQLNVSHKNDLLIISNAPDEVSKLLQRIGNLPDKKFGSLSKQRSWQQVQNQLDEKSDSPQIRGYVSPERSPHLVSWLLDSRSWQIPIFTLESLASVGFQIQLDETTEVVEAPHGNFKPIINWYSVVNLRAPAKGLAKLIESYEPLPNIPNFPFELTFLEASGFDFGRKHNANFELDQILMREPVKPSDPENPSEDEQITFWTEFGVEEMPEKFEMTPVLKAYDGQIQLFHTGLEAFVQDEIRIDWHNDQKAMQKILSQRTLEGSGITTAESGYIQVDYGHGLHFARKPNSEKTYRKMVQPQLETQDKNEPEKQSQDDSNDVVRKRFKITLTIQSSFISTTK